MNDDPVITLALPLHMINQALLALAELPAKVSMGVIQEVRRQTQDWIAAQEKAQAVDLSPPTPPADGRAEGQ